MDSGLNVSYLSRGLEPMGRQGKKSFHRIQRDEILKAVGATGFFRLAILATGALEVRYPSDSQQGVVNEVINCSKKRLGEIRIATVNTQL